MSFQDPSVVFSIAKKHSAFCIKRNGVVRSIDKLNASGSFAKDDGVFAPSNLHPISFEPVKIKAVSADGAESVSTTTTLAHTRNAQGQIRSFLVSKKNAKSFAKKVGQRKNAGRKASVQAARARRVIRSTTRALSLKKQE